jgi:hypothetical protein
MNSLLSLSRRRLLGASAAAWALGPFAARAEEIGDSQMPLPATDTLHGDADRDHRMTVDARIDGQGPFRFLVDTGADRSVIASDVATKLGLLGGTDVVVQGISRSVPATTARLKSLEVGPIALRDIALPVLSREWLGADGYLGLDVLNQRKVTFDFRHQSLTIHHSQLTVRPVSSPDLVVHVSGSRGRLTAFDCRVDDVPAAAFVDSGAETSIGNSRLFAELQKQGATYVSDRIVPITDVTGGSVPGRITSFSTIKMGAISFLRANLLICDLEVFDVWGLADRPALFIGMNFLGQTSAFSIDFGRKELHFKLADVQMARRI